MEMSRQRGRRIAWGAGAAGVAVILVALIALRGWMLERYWATRLGSADPASRLQAVQRLGELRAAGAIPDIIRALGRANDLDAHDAGGPDQVFVSAARGALDRIVREAPAEAAETIPAVLTLVASTDLRGEYATTAVEYGQGDLRGYEPARVLAAIGKPAVSPLLRGLEAPDPFVRAFAAWVLGEIGPPALEARTALRDRLLDPAEPWYVRLYLAQALGKLGPDPQVVGALADGLEDRHPAVRRHCLVGLGQMWEAAVPIAPVLERIAARDEAAGNRQLAREILEWSGKGPQQPESSAPGTPDPGA